MKLILNPLTTKNEKCLVLIGGVGDPAEIFKPLVSKLANRLPDHTICTFTFSQKSSGISLLDLQSKELGEVLNQLINHHNFKTLDLWCTSMGSYATVNVLIDPAYSKHISHAIFFDPADYYLDDLAMNVEQETTWSGYQDYKPTKPTIITQMAKLTSETIVSVVHLSVRNHGRSGYIESEYSRRNIDNPTGFTRLNTRMVKSFYDNTPEPNRGKYLEIDNLPHAVFRDGDVEYNLQTITEQIVATVL